MKLNTLLATAVLLGGFSALACPDLSGTYDCKGEQLVVNTYELNGVTYYELNGDTMPADNNWYNLPDQEDQKNARVKLSCDNNASYGDHARLDYESDMYDQGNKIGFITAQMYFYLSGQNLEQVITGKVKGNWGESDISQRESCSKL